MLPFLAISTFKITAFSFMISFKVCKIIILGSGNRVVVVVVFCVLLSIEGELVTFLAAGVGEGGIITIIIIKLTLILPWL